MQPLGRSRRQKIELRPSRVVVLEDAFGRSFAEIASRDGIPIAR